MYLPQYFGRCFEERLSPTQASFWRDQKLVLEAAGVMMKGVKLVQDSYPISSWDHYARTWDQKSPGMYLQMRR